MHELADIWKKDKLQAALLYCWLITVFSSFFGSCLFPINIPGIGCLFLFRMILPVTALLYVVRVVKTKDAFWKTASATEKWCWILIGSMLLYGTVSLFRAIDFMWSFQRLFNLCFDLAFFFLMLRLCRDKRVFHCTLAVCAAAVLILFGMGLFEIYHGGIFNPEYDDFKRLFLFSWLGQYPVVTFGNTNDYAASLAFIGTVLLVFAAYHWGNLKAVHFRLLAAGFAAMYFVAVVCSARLVIGAVYLLFAGLIVFLLLRDRKRLWICAVILLCMVCVQFVTEYRHIVPPIQQYLAELKEYRQQVQAPETTPPEQQPVPEKPELVIGDPNKESLTETFYTVDEETGEKDLGGRSNGMRVLLILHAFRCFKESHFLGVGLGNTEMLAKVREVVPHAELINIHCFVARIIGDFGIFVLIPLTVVGLLLLKRVWQALACGIRCKNRQMIAMGVLSFFALCAYPVLSTISSDAQDLISMWIYLAAVVLYAEWLQNDTAPLPMKPVANDPA